MFLFFPTRELNQIGDNSQQWFNWVVSYFGVQVGGYTQGYDGLTFVTIRNSGHEVPLYQPARGLSLITSYITDVPLPTEKTIQ